MSEPSLAEVAEANVVDGCAGWASWSEAELHRTRELTWTISSIRFPLFNVVLRAQLPGEGIDASLAAATAPYRERDLPFAWWVGPSTRPAGLGERLEALGLAHAGTCAGMTAELDALHTGVRDPAGLSVEEVLDEPGLARWCAVLGEVHGLPEIAEGPFFRLHAALCLHGQVAGPRWRLFLGSVNGRPVATVALLHGSAQGRAAAALADLATRRVARGRGVATALSLYALLQARAAGYALATTCAAPAAEPLLRRLGFAPRCQLHLFLSGAADR